MIWCVEDDASIRDIEVYALTSTGFEAAGFEDGDAFWAALQSAVPELVILDVMLPGKDGVTLLKMMKQEDRFREIPVIMATARGTEYDKIQSLDLGADDYLVKPFGMMEMVARIKAVLRRTTPKTVTWLTCGDIVLDESRHTVTVRGKLVSLTLKEYELLKLLMENIGQVFTREILLSRIWGMDYIGETRTVDVHIGTLRTKLAGSGERIETVRGVGYKMVDTDEQKDI